MWILELYTIQSMLKLENKSHNEMCPCIIAAADTVQGITGRKIEDRSAETKLGQAQLKTLLQFICIELMKKTYYWLD